MKASIAYIYDTTEAGILHTAQEIPVFYIKQICNTVWQQFLTWLDVS